MKKQILTKQDIQQELLLTVSKLKRVALFLSFFLAITIIAYIYNIINYEDILNEYLYHHGHGHPAIGLVVGPICFVILIAFLLYYCITLYKAKKGKFTITKETLYYQKKELIVYYKHTQKENSLYFRCGRVSVSKEVYDSAKVGDSFYAVILKGRKAPSLVYNTKHYEIESPEQEK